MYNVYVIRSISRNYIYVGLTNNLDRRIQEHQLGKNPTTRAYKPFEVVFSEKFVTRPEARVREKYLKSGCGKEWIRNNLKFARVAELVDAYV
ncbi:MAG: GIY-YIG nuclease family protein [Candidatus Omnitrophica bacterium]|nr:GIY-YIG nuclease family protein [Candidatus Omnitrophota bacterium]